MTAFIIRRLLYTIPIVFGVLLLTFLLFTLIGGDISYQIAGKNADAETIAEIRHEYGLDKPLFFGEDGAFFDSQFFNHFKNALTFDFGNDLNRELITERIWRGVGPSLALTTPMFLGTLVISISVALIVAFVRGSLGDVILVVICVAGMSIPYLSFIIFGQYCLCLSNGLVSDFLCAGSADLDQYCVTGADRYCGRAGRQSAVLSHRDAG